MRGRKPKPTVLKLVDGTTPCRINHDEPPTKPGSLAVPGWIASNPKAVEHWNEIAPIAHRMGLLTEDSRFALAELCDEFSIMRSTKRNGAAKDRYRKLLLEFGFTPCSRSKIRATVQAPQDKLQDLLD